jgi:hypothetical protein
MAVLNEYDQTIISAWMRHLSSVGDEILIPIKTKTFRGKVLRVALTALDTADYFSYNSLSLRIIEIVHILVDELQPCTSPLEESIWFSPH